MKASRCDKLGGGSTHGNANTLLLQQSDTFTNTHIVLQYKINSIH